MLISVSSDPIYSKFAVHLFQLWLAGSKRLRQDHATALYSGPTEGEPWIRADTRPAAGNVRPRYSRPSGRIHAPGETKSSFLVNDFFSINKKV